MHKRRWKYSHFLEKCKRVDIYISKACYENYLCEYDAAFSVESEPLIEIKNPLGVFMYFRRPNKDRESHMAQE